MSSKPSCRSACNHVRYRPQNRVFFFRRLTQACPAGSNRPEPSTRGIHPRGPEQGDGQLQGACSLQTCHVRRRALNGMRPGPCPTPPAPRAGGQRAGGRQDHQRVQTSLQGGEIPVAVDSGSTKGIPAVWRRHRSKKSPNERARGLIISAHYRREQLGTKPRARAKSAAGGLLCVFKIDLNEGATWPVELGQFSMRAPGASREQREVAEPRNPAYARA